MLPLGAACVLSVHCVCDCGRSGGRRGAAAATDGNKSQPILDGETLVMDDYTAYSFYSYIDIYLISQYCLIEYGAIVAKIDY